MKLSDIFSDRMVLQRNKEIRVFGEGEGEGYVDFCGKHTPFSCEDGHFLATLPAEEAGGPYTLTVSLGGECITLSDVMVGDVYIAAGQSNMELPVWETVDIFPIDCEGVRLYERRPTEIGFVRGRHECGGDVWEYCTADTARNFSAIGLAFGRNLHASTGVPVGILMCAIGASRIDAWTPAEIVNTPTYREWVPSDYQTYGNYLFNEPGWCFANKLLPLCPFSVAGVLFYQGEANTKPPACYHYDKLLSEMIGAWRGALADDALPFYIVQLAPHTSTVGGANWAAVRAGQERASRTLPHVKMVTIPETGESRLIHPARKAAVAGALVNAVLTDLSGKAHEYSGPIAERFEPIEHGLRVTFSHAEGLHIVGKYITDTFAFDERGVPTSVFAAIEENVLTLSWRQDMHAVRVSMGEQNDAHHNLYNASGYLASPFSFSLGEITGKNDSPQF